jgi:hypothetical protein
MPSDAELNKHFSNVAEKLKKLYTVWGSAFPEDASTLLQHGKNESKRYRTESIREKAVKKIISDKLKNHLKPAINKLKNELLGKVTEFIDGDEILSAVRDNVKAGRDMVAGLTNTQRAVVEKLIQRSSLNKSTKSVLSHLVRKRKISDISKDIELTDVPAVETPTGILSRRFAGTNEIELTDFAGGEEVVTELATAESAAAEAEVAASETGPAGLAFAVLMSVGVDFIKAETGEDAGQIVMDHLSDFAKAAAYHWIPGYAIYDVSKSLINLGKNLPEMSREFASGLEDVATPLHGLFNGIPKETPETTAAMNKYNAAIHAYNTTMNSALKSYKHDIVGAETTYTPSFMPTIIEVNPNGPVYDRTHDPNWAAFNRAYDKRNGIPNIADYSSSSAWRAAMRAVDVKHLVKVINYAQREEAFNKAFPVPTSLPIRDEDIVAHHREQVLADPAYANQPQDAASVEAYFAAHQKTYIDHDITDINIKRMYKTFTNIERDRVISDFNAKNSGSIELFKQNHPGEPVPHTLDLKSQLDAFDKNVNTLTKRIIHNVNTSGDYNHINLPREDVNALAYTSRNAEQHSNPIHLMKTDDILDKLEHTPLDIEKALDSMAWSSAAYNTSSGREFLQSYVRHYDDYAIHHIDADHDTQALVALSSNRSPPRVIIACRGTESIRDVVTDVEATKSQFSMNDDFIESAAVHTGFQRSAQTLCQHVAAVIRGRGGLEQGSEIMFCGHSLGGALATLISADMELRKLLKPFAALDAKDRFVPEVWTWGCPRVGNSAFASEYHRKVNVKHIRVTNHRDIVARLPPTELGFRHVGLEYNVRYDGTFTVIVGDGASKSTHAHRTQRAPRVTDHLMLSYERSMRKVRQYLKGLPQMEEGTISSIRRSIGNAAVEGVRAIVNARAWQIMGLARVFAPTPDVSIQREDLQALLNNHTITDIASQSIGEAEASLPKESKNTVKSLVLHFAATAAHHDPEHQVNEQSYTPGQPMSRESIWEMYAPMNKIE